VHIFKDKLITILYVNEEALAESEDELHITVQQLNTSVNVELKSLP
jgi:hypothetical protein